jgi:hypothetical protein
MLAPGPSSRKVHRNYFYPVDLTVIYDMLCEHFGTAGQVSYSHVTELYLSDGAVRT